MASFLYASPDPSSNAPKRVVLITRPAPTAQRGGRYVGGSIEPLVEVAARVKRASK